MIVTVIMIFITVIVVIQMKTFLPKNAQAKQI